MICLWCDKSINLGTHGPGAGFFGRYHAWCWRDHHKEILLALKKKKGTNNAVEG